MTGMVNSKNSDLRKDFLQQIAENRTLTKEQKTTRAKYVEKAYGWMQWAQKPIDKYGMSFYLSAKVSSLATVGGSALAISYGLDVTAMLQVQHFNTKKTTNHI